MREFNTEELGKLAAALLHYHRTFPDSGVEGLRDRIVDAHTERLELEDMDLDDCAGGACKL